MSDTVRQINLQALDARIVEAMADSSSLANRYRRREDAYAMLVELRKAGFEVVPVEATLEMRLAGFGRSTLGGVWRAMVGAARK